MDISAASGMESTHGRKMMIEKYDNQKNANGKEEDDEDKEIK
jgi:hypothetical protein